MKNRKIKITWEIEDGYAGGRRPQYTYADLSEYNELETQEEKDQYIEECIEEDMRQINFIIKDLEFPENCK